MLFEAPLVIHAVKRCNLYKSSCLGLPNIEISVQLICLGLPSKELDFFPFHPSLSNGGGCFPQLQQICGRRRGHRGWRQSSSVAEINQPLSMPHPLSMPAVTLRNSHRADACSHPYCLRVTHPPSWCPSSSVTCKNFSS